MIKGVLWVLTVFPVAGSICLRDAHGEDIRIEETFISRTSDESLQDFWRRAETGGLVEFGGGYKAADSNRRTRLAVSDLHLSTVEFSIGIPLNDWIRADVTFLYEGSFDGESSGLNLGAASITFGNAEKLPLYLSLGKLYVPFGALLTHLPDDPSADQPMTLLLGEASENAVLLGIGHAGLSLSGYMFRGEMQQSRDGVSFGFDVRYDAPEGSRIELLLGASYISNIADSDGLTAAIQSNTVAIAGDIGGIGAYAHAGFRGFFADGEYMTALDSFRAGELPQATGGGARPAAWNIEAGYSWNWGRKLEAVIKYAGSRDTEGLGLARKRFGFGLNQEIVRHVTASFAFLKDRYHAGDVQGRTEGFTVLGQVAVSF